MSKKLIRFDWAIKRLLRNKANFVVLEGFLSELLFEPIRIEQMLESESNQASDEDKFNRVDILTQNARGERIIIEIQNTYEIDYFHRMAYGTAKVLAEHLNLGQGYADVVKVISVNIIYFDLGQGDDYIYRGTTTFEGLHQKDTLQLSQRQKDTFRKQTVADVFPEYYIIKVNKFNDVAKDTLDEWVYFLKNSEVQDSFRAQGLREAQDVLDIMRLTKEQQYGYDMYIASVLLRASEAFSMKEEAEHNVRMDERQKNMLDVARTAIKQGLGDSMIARLTGLSESEITRLREPLEP